MYKQRCNEEFREGSSKGCRNEYRKKYREEYRKEYRSRVQGQFLLSTTSKFRT